MQGPDRGLSKGFVAVDPGRAASTRPPAGRVARDPRFRSVPRPDTQPTEVHPPGTGLREKAGDQRLRDPEGKRVGEVKPAVLSRVISWLLTSGLAPKNSASHGLSRSPYPSQPPPDLWLSFEATTHTGPAPFPEEASQGSASNPAVRASAAWWTCQGP